MLRPNSTRLFLHRYKGLRVGSEKKSCAVYLKPASALQVGAGFQSHCAVCDFFNFCQTVHDFLHLCKAARLGGKQYMTFRTQAK